MQKSNKGRGGEFHIEDMSTLGPKSVFKLRIAGIPLNVCVFENETLLVNTFYKDDIRALRDVCNQALNDEGMSFDEKSWQQFKDDTPAHTK